MKETPTCCCSNCENSLANDCYLIKRGLPCDFHPIRKRDEPDRRIGIIIAVIIIATAMVTLILWGCSQKKVEPQPVEHVSAMTLLRAQHAGDLSDWQMLILAISFTESRFNPDAVGSAGDRGVMQIRSIYVDEVNRIAGTNYIPEDAFDIDKSLEMFRLMQETYNPNKDIQEGIRHHNKSAAYRQRVLDNLEMIRRYEALRAKVVEY